MATNGKRKGKEGELELAHKLKEYGYDAKRSVQYNGKDGQADVLGLPHIHIECKRVEKLNIYDAVDQAKRDAKNGDKPAVFHRKNRCNWLVTMELDSFMELYAGFIDNGRLIKAIENKIKELSGNG
jgi:Holliday junction resolvase